jgi:hypothetical protein
MAMARPTHPRPTVDMGRDEEVLTLIEGQEARTCILLCPEHCGAEPHGLLSFPYCDKEGRAKNRH